MTATGDGTGINFSTGGVYFAQDADDRALVRRALAGEHEAFEALVERFKRVFFTVALRMLGDRDEAADAVQNAFVKIYQKLDTFDPSRRFFSWAYRVLVNECLNTQRARRQFEPLSLDVPGGGDPLESLEADERRRRVQAAILALPHESREVVVLRHFTELSYEEIGAALHLPPQIVKSRLHTARHRLAQLLIGFKGND